MRLRDSVRPPQRLESELFYQPTPQRSSRRGGTPSRPTYIDFNPNLPPAAFPTLKAPCPVTDIQGYPHGRDEQNEGYQSDIQMADASSSPQRDLLCHPDRETDDEIEDVPVEDMDNYLASNGPQNQIYTRNMAIIAGFGQQSQIPTAVDDVDADVTDCAGDNEATRLELLSLSDPEWSDLSPKLRVEIVENMLQDHPWPKIVSMLGLTYEDDEEIRNHIINRDRQIEDENTQLGEMRAKQLKALMLIDNSALRLNKPPQQLVFRKTSRRYTRKLKERNKSDYLLCQAREVLAARRFLHKRGLNARFAGRWSNEMVVLRSSFDKPHLEALDWKPDLKSNLQTVPTMPLSSSCMQNLHSEHENDYSPISNMDSNSMQTQVNFINGFGMESTVDPSELQVRQGDMISPSKQPSTISQQPPPRHGILRLKIGVERAAKIRDIGNIGTQSGERYVDIDKTLNQSIMQSKAGEHQHPSQMFLGVSIPRKRNFSELSQQPVLRAMGGPWSYDSIEENLDAAVTSSGRLRQKLEAARSEAQEQRETAIFPQNDNNCNVSQLGRLQNTSLPIELPIRVHPQCPLAPSVGGAFPEPRPGFVTSEFTLGMLESVEQARSEERQNTSPKQRGQQEQGAMVVSINKPQCKYTETEEKNSSTEEAESKQVFYKDEIDYHQTNMQKYDRDETPEIKESVTNIPLHSDSTRDPLNLLNDEKERSGEQMTTTVRLAVEVPVQPAPIRLILRHGGQQRQSMPNSCVSEPRLTGSVSGAIRSGLDHALEIATQPRASKGSRRKSAPAPATKQKASSKKDPPNEPKRRSERLNGPPNQRVLRRRT